MVLPFHIIVVYAGTQWRDCFLEKAVALRFPGPITNQQLAWLIETRTKIAQVDWCDPSCLLTNSGAAMQQIFST